MTRAVLADTGPLYAAVDPHDQYHARSQEQLQTLADEGLSVVLAYPILLETYTLIRYRLGATSAFSWLEDVRDGSAWVNPSPQDYREAAAWVERFPTSPSLCSMPPWRSSQRAYACRCGPMTTTSTRWEPRSGVEHDCPGAPPGLRPSGVECGFISMIAVWWQSMRFRWRPIWFQDCR